MPQNFRKSKNLIIKLLFNKKDILFCFLVIYSIYWNANGVLHKISFLAMKIVFNAVDSLPMQ